jgi:predicted porin
MNKKLLAVAISGALTAPMAAHAVKYALSGQINRAVVFLDDDVATDVQHVDNVSSGTRVRLTGSEDIGGGMKVGMNWEWQNSSNPGSGGARLKSADYGRGEAIRQAEVWFSGSWGKLSIGQGDGAGNGTTEVDLSDVWNAGVYHGRTSFGSSLPWRTGMGNGITAAGAATANAGNLITGGGKANTALLTHGSTFSSFDAFSRYDRIRYDTPKIGPVTLSASIGQNERWEVAGRLSTALGGGQLSAAMFYGSTGGIDDRFGGSASFLFSQGTNFTFAYATNDPGGATTDADTIYFKLGHKWGNNAVGIAYGEASDVTPGFDDSGWAIGFNHNIPKAKVDIYAAYMLHELDTPAGKPSVGDQSAFLVGTKLKFD